MLCVVCVCLCVCVCVCLLFVCLSVCMCGPVAVNPLMVAWKHIPCCYLVVVCCIASAFSKTCFRQCGWWYPWPCGRDQVSGRGLLIASQHEYSLHKRVPKGAKFWPQCRRIAVGCHLCHCQLNVLYVGTWNVHSLIEALGDCQVYHVWHDTGMERKLDFLVKELSRLTVPSKGRFNSSPALLALALFNIRSDFLRSCYAHTRLSLCCYLETFLAATSLDQPVKYIVLYPDHIFFPWREILSVMMMITHTCNNESEEYMYVLL